MPPLVENPAVNVGAMRSQIGAAGAAYGAGLVHNLYGDVRITAWDRDEVLVEATKHSSDAGRLKDARIVVDTSTTRGVVLAQAHAPSANPATKTQNH